MLEFHISSKYELHMSPSVSLARQAAIFLLQQSFAHAFMSKQLEKYIKIIYAFDSAHVKYGVWIKAGLQAGLIGSADLN